MQRVDARIAKEVHRALGVEPPRCRAAILFGSRASGDESRDSDWDVLLVLDEPDRAPDCRSAPFDVVMVSTRNLDSLAWRNSELASHIHCHGRMVWGDAEWQQPSDLREAAGHKADRLRRRIASFLRLGPHLSSSHRVRHLTRMAWDLQRFAFLAEGRPVPSTSVVARAWDALESDARWALMACVLQPKHVIALEGHLLRLCTSSLQQSSRRHRDGMTNVWLPYGQCGADTTPESP